MIESDVIISFLCLIVGISHELSTMPDDTPYIQVLDTILDYVESLETE